MLLLERSWSPVYMDLSSLSMAGSPASHRRGYPRPLPTSAHTPCPSQLSQAGYSSPVLGDCHYQGLSLFSPDDSGSVLMDIQSASWKSRQDTMAQTLWRTSARSNSASSSIGNIPSTDYEPFSNYEACLSTTYPASEGYPPLSTSVALSRTPSSSTSATAPVSVSSAGSITFAQDHVIRGTRMADGTSHSTGHETSLYPATAGLHASYAGNRIMFSSSLQPYVLDDAESLWSREPYDTRHRYHEAPTRACSRPGTARRSESVGRPRRAIRKHTTKEEANFQCQIEGCGKFFSRSYNYRSHMETHDESREYAFPCTVEDCTKKFVRKTDLQRHHQSVHMKERNHRCDYCGRPFARKDTLRRHMEDGCSKRFDIGTLDVESEVYKEPSRSYAGGFPPNPELLPPIAQSTIPVIQRQS